VRREQAQHHQRAQGLQDAGRGPCSTRASTTSAKLWARLPATLATVSTATAARNSRRKPMRSSSQEVGSIDRVMAAMKPVTAHCTWSWPRPNCWLSAVTATLKAEVASTPAMVPVATVISSSHL
jgi:hypothetical protein